jgi:hypothetical protein
LTVLNYNAGISLRNGLVGTKVTRLELVKCRLSTLQVEEIVAPILPTLRFLKVYANWLPMASNLFTVLGMPNVLSSISTLAEFPSVVRRRFIVIGSNAVRTHNPRYGHHKRSFVQVKPTFRSGPQ